jgi:glutamine cyclotransferase
MLRLLLALIIVIHLPQTRPAWHSDRIVKVSPADGRVLGWIDMTGLLAQLPAAERPSEPEAVVNRIAYDAAGDRLFVTGKLWPKIFEVKIVPK